MNTINDDNLKIAAENGDINLLYRVIQEEPQVGDLFDMAETPLHIAAAAGHLQFATEIGHRRMVLRFVSINKDVVRVKGRESLTPLHFASQTGVDLLANFLSACPDSIEDVTVRDEIALHIAVKNQQYQALQVLIGWLKRTHQSAARELENTILNMKDEEGNTILHISALNNDSRTLQLLVKTKMDLNAKNFENSTALDIAASEEIESILFRARAKRGTSVTDAPTFADTLRSNITVMDEVLIYILRIRKDITEEQRNALLIVAAHVATATYQSALSPPSGVYQLMLGIIM
ncbi:Ankyrin repeat [Sesbania bispinosa]|nr:Ankyrin repeat [Sesbania bispinosa]